MKFDWRAALKNKTLIRALITAALLGLGLPQVVPLVPVAVDSACIAVGGCAE